VPAADVGPLDHLGRLAVLETSCCLSPDGARLLSATGHHRWLFLDVVDVASGRVRRRGRLRAPVVVEGTCDVTWEPDRLRLLDRDHRHLVELEPDGWDVLACHDLAALVPDSERIDSVRLVPGTPYAWIESFDLDRYSYLRTYDLARRRVARELDSHGVHFEPVPGATPRVFVDTRDQHGQLFDGRGVPLPDGRVRLPGELHQVGVDPDGERVFLVVGLDRGLDEDDEDLVLELHMAEPSRGAEPRRVQVLPDPFVEGHHLLHVRPGGRELLVAWARACYDVGGETRYGLRTLRQGADGRFTATRKSALEPPTCVARDVRGQHAVLLQGRLQGVRVDSISALVPAPDAALDAEAAHDPALDADSAPDAALDAEAAPALDAESAHAPAPDADSAHDLALDPAPDAEAAHDPALDSAFDAEADPAPSAAPDPAPDPAPSAAPDPAPDPALDAEVNPDPLLDLHLPRLDAVQSLCRWQFTAPFGDMEVTPRPRDEAPLGERLETLWREHRDSPERLAQLIADNTYAPAPETWALLDRALERHPDHLLLRFLDAERLAQHRRWSEVEAALHPDQLDLDALPSAAQAHRLHQIGRAHV